MKKSRITRSFSILAWFNSKVGYVPNSYRNHIDIDWNKTLKEDREWKYKNDMGIKYHWKAKKMQKELNSFLGKEVTVVYTDNKSDAGRLFKYKYAKGVYQIETPKGEISFRAYHVKECHPTDAKRQ